MILIGISGSIGGGSRPVIIGGDGGGLQWDIDIGRRHRTSCRILGTFCFHGSGVILMVILIVISIIIIIIVITVRIILFQAT